MSTELHHIELGPLAGFSGFSERIVPAQRYLKPGLLVLVIAALAVWLIWSASDGDSAESKPEQSSTAAVDTAPPLNAAISNPGAPANAAYAPPPAAAEQAPPINGLSISSQSWRRGGLGSKALVTFTLRNNNDYAVKDIELVCAFVRRDGSHLTDRKRVISDTVNMKSRKTFAGVLVGFVNVNASRAKCAAVAASRS